MATGREAGQAAVAGQGMARAVASRAAAMGQEVVRSAQETAGLARARVSAEAHRLEHVRDEHQVAATEAFRARVDDLADKAYVTERAVDAIVKELVSAFSSGPTRVANDAPQMPSPVPGLPPPSSPTPRPTSEAAFRLDHQTKAAQAVALIEKIEVFVRSGQRPTLALTLNNSLGAWVEIEKVAQGKVAVKLVGQSGPPSPDAVSRIRDELRARGLSVASLSVA